MSSRSALSTLPYSGAVYETQRTVPHKKTQASNSPYIIPSYLPSTKTSTINKTSTTPRPSCGRLPTDQRNSRAVGLLRMMAGRLKPWSWSSVEPWPARSAGCWAGTRTKAPNRRRRSRSGSRWRWGLGTGRAVLIRGSTQTFYSTSGSTSASSHRAGCLFLCPSYRPNPFWISCPWFIGLKYVMRDSEII